MADGDAAAAAGLPLVASTDDVRDGYNHHNRTRDQIVTWAAPVGHNHDGSYVQQGGSDVGLLTISHGGGRAQLFGDGVFKGYIAYLSDIGSYLPTSGGTVTGHLYLPNAVPANTGYAVAYLNADGRVSRGASSERYKEDIDRTPELPDVFAVPLASFVMKGDPDQIVRYGYIAEDLDANEATASFVVYDDQQRPDSYDMIGLLLAQVAHLNERVKQLEAGAA